MLNVSSDFSCGWYIWQSFLSGPEEGKLHDPILVAEATFAGTGTFIRGVITPHNRREIFPAVIVVFLDVFGSFYRDPFLSTFLCSVLGISLSFCCIRGESLFVELPIGVNRAVFTSVA